MRSLLTLLNEVWLFQTPRAFYPSLGQNSLQLLDTKLAVVRLAVYLDGCGGGGRREGGREWFFLVSSPCIRYQPLPPPSLPHSLF